MLYPQPLSRPSLIIWTWRVTSHGHVTSLYNIVLMLYQHIKWTNMPFPSPTECGVCHHHQHPQAHSYPSQKHDVSFETLYFSTSFFISSKSVVQYCGQKVQIPSEDFFLMKHSCLRLKIGKSYQTFLYLKFKFTFSRCKEIDTLHSKQHYFENAQNWGGVCAWLEQEGEWDTPYRCLYPVNLKTQKYFLCLSRDMIWFLETTRAYFMTN